MSLIYSPEFAIALRHSILKRVTTDRLKGQDYGGIKIQESQKTEKTVETRDFQKDRELELEKQLYGGLDLDIKFREDSIQQGRRKGKLNNNCAVFNNDVYRNFLDIKDLGFDIFLRLIEVYKWEIDQRTSMTKIQT